MRPVARPDGDAGAAVPGQGTFPPYAAVACSSRATSDYSQEQLADLLRVSRDNNARLMLTGVLLYREGRFLLYLGGPTGAVSERIDIIAADARHDDFQVRFQMPVTARLFGAWSMGFERVTTAEAENIPGYRRSFVDTTNDPDGREAQGAMSGVARWFTSRDEEKYRTKLRPGQEDSSARWPSRRASGLDSFPTAHASCQLA